MSINLDELLLIADAGEGAGKHKLAAALVKRNRVLGVGLNRSKTHPLQAKFGKNEQSIHLHAEIDAIKNALKRHTVDELVGSTLMVARIKKDGTPGSACPCSGCQRAIIHFGIKEVIHT